MTSGLIAECLEWANAGYWEKVLEIVEEHPELASIEDASNSTLLIHLAGYEASADVLKLLIEIGADINHVSKHDDSALINAIEGGSNYGLTTIPELRVILDAGADVAIYDCRGNTALHWAILENRLQHAELLLNYGANPYQLNKDIKPENAFEIAQENERATKMLQKWLTRK